MQYQRIIFSRFEFPVIAFMVKKKRKRDLPFKLRIGPFDNSLNNQIPRIILIFLGC